MKIALVLNDDFSMWQFRKGLIISLLRRGFDVYVITPGGPYINRLESLGARHIEISIKRFISPFDDFILFLQLYKIFRREKFDIVHTMTIKPNIYGPIAARLSGIGRVVGLVSGTGFLFGDVLNRKVRFIRFLAKGMYRLAFRLSDRVWFQNEDDLNEFLEMRLLNREKALVIRSGGINLEEYDRENLNLEDILQVKKELGLSGDCSVVTMMTARMVWAKGVREFIEAAEFLSPRFPKARFILVAPLDESSPDHVPSDYLRKKGFPELTIIPVFRDDAKYILAISDVITLPSYYREGIPRVLLEAMALEKPIVTTESIGCKEVVDNEKNGFLIPPRNSIKLAEAIGILLENTDMRNRYGIYSRMKAKREFDEKLVIAKIFTHLYQFQPMSE